MIRRWTLINNFNVLEENISFYKRKHKLHILKRTLILRRFMKKYTKVRRKSYRRLKHKSNWFIYHNVFKYWILDFQKNKYLVKNQFINGFFLNNFFFFHKNFFKNKNNIENNCDFFFHTFSKKTLSPFFFNYYLINKKKNNLSNLNYFFFFNQNNTTQSWSKQNYSDSLANFNKNDIISTYSEWENQLFSSINTNYSLIKLPLINFLQFFNNLYSNIFFKLKLFYIFFIYTIKF